MKTKIFQISLAFIVAFFSVYFALSPIFEHKIYDDFMNANVGKLAAEAGFEDIAQRHLNLIKDENLKLEVELYLAILKSSKDENFDGGKFKYNDFFKAKKIERSILAENDAFKKMLEFKYLPQINTLKYPYNRAYCLYVLAIKTGDSEHLLSNAAFGEIQKISNFKVKDEYILKIAELAIANSRSEDFFKFARLASRHYRDVLVCCDMYKNGNTIKDFSKLKNKSNIFYCSDRIWNVYSDLSKKKEKHEILITRLKYVATVSGSWGVYNCDEISYSAISYIAHLAGREDAEKKYKELALSRETLAKFAHTKARYLTYCAAIFAKMGDWQLALETAKASSISANRELKSLNEILDFLPKERDSLEALSKRVEYLTSKKAKFEQIAI